MEILVPLLIIVLLILANGLFVAAEFSILGAPRPKLEQKSSEGHLVARKVLEILNDPERQDRYIATAQLGVTIASLALGMYGEHTLSLWILPMLERFGLGLAASHSVATVLTVGLVTYLHVVLGEMIPKSLALASAERTVLRIQPLMQFFGLVTAPLVYLLNSMGNALMRLLGVPLSPALGKAYSLEELQIVVDESSEEGLLNEDYADLFRNLLELPERKIYQIMQPRTAIVGIPKDLAAERLLAFIDQAGHSRYPVYEGDLDHIVGALHIKDVLRRYVEQPEALKASELMQPPLFVPESASATWLLDQMRARRIHLAVVLDEFGGTAGVATFEDVLEQVVGEVRDEFDVEEHEPIVPLEGGDYRVQGSVLLDKLNESFDLSLPADQVDTVGGLALAQLARPAQIGDRFEVGGARFEVIALQGLGVAQVRLGILPKPEEP